MRYFQFILLASLLCSFLQVPSAYGSEKPRLKIGVLLSLSGGLEQWCGYMRQGAELAASEESSVDVSLIFEDDRSVDKKTSLAAAHKLIHANSVAAIFSWTLSTVPTLAPLVNQSRTPLIIGAYDPRINQAGPYVFGGVVNLLLVPREIARLLHKRGVVDTALVLAADEWSASFEAPFREEAAKLGMKIVFTETVLPNDSDLRSVVSNLKRREVKGVLAPLFGPPLLSFIRRARELKLGATISVGDGMFEEDIQTLGDAAEGVTATQIWVDSPELVSKVTSRYGVQTDPLQLGLIASGYDMIKHIILTAEQIHKKGEPLTGENLQRTLRNFTSLGYLGKHMLGAGPGYSGEKPVVVKNGRYVLTDNSPVAQTK